MSSLSPKEILKLPSKWSFLRCLKTNFHLSVKIAPRKTKQGWEKAGEESQVTDRALGTAPPGGWGRRRQPVPWPPGKHPLEAPPGPMRDTWRVSLPFPSPPSALVQVSSPFPKCSSLFYNSILKKKIFWQQDAEKTGVFKWSEVLNGKQKLLPPRQEAAQVPPVLRWGPDACFPSPLPPARVTHAEGGTDTPQHVTGVSPQTHCRLKRSLSLKHTEDTRPIEHQPSRVSEVTRGVKGLPRSCDQLPLPASQDSIMLLEREQTKTQGQSLQMNVAFTPSESGKI